MTLTIDSSGNPYIDASGNFKEVLMHLAAQNVAAGDIVGLVWDGTSVVHCVYRR